ncbi:MAG: response regulator [Chloroflexi bacterium]|nr:response regulator [Chloroflexota bacterium]
MSGEPGRILVVDDTALNRAILSRALHGQGHEVVEAGNGRAALDILATDADRSIDVILLDIEMPEMDGYEALSRMKADPALRDLPVIVISAVDALDSIVRCIEMGAADYLPKPFNAAILRARVSTSLASKRLRDLELEYLEQVGRLTAAATAVEAGAFDPAALEQVSGREDALGQLARTFQRMAVEVRAREDRLRAEVRELRIEIDATRQSRKVAEITETDFFRDLRERAPSLRRIVDEPGG